MKSRLSLSLLLTCCLLSAGAVEMTKNHLLDGSHSSFTPTVTTSNLNNGGHVAMSRTAPLVYTAQNRDSYANAAQQAGYNLGGTSGNNQQQNVGTTGSQQQASASSISSSYGVPATGGSVSGGYGGQPVVGTNPQGSMTYYYYHYPGGQQAQASGAVGNGWGEPTTGWGAGEDDDSGFGSGIGGLAGLLGLKGLKGLGGLGLLALFKLFKPLLFPLFFPLLFLLPLLLLFIPIPVITIPTQGRSMGPSTIGEIVTEKVYSSVQMAQDVISSSQCIEKIACEINRKSKGTYVDNFISGVLDKTETYMSKKWRRGMRAYIDSGFLPDSDTKCAKFTCDMYNEITTRFSSGESRESKDMKTMPSVSSSSEKSKKSGKTKEN